MTSVSKIMACFLGIGCGLVLSGIEVRAGLTFRVLDLFTMLSAALFYVLVLPKGLPLKGSMPFVAVATVYMIYVALNGIFLRNTSIGIKEGIQLFVFLNFFVMLVYALKRETTTNTYLWFFLASLWVIAIYNAVFHISIGYYSGWKELDEPKLSHSVILIIMVVMAMVYTGLSKAWKTMLVIAILFVVLSGERKGWVGAAFGVFVSTLISDSGMLEKRAISRALGLIVVIAALVMAILPFADSLPYVGRQLGSIIDFVKLATENHGVTALTYADTTISNRARIFAIQRGIEWYTENPAFGVGIENYKLLMDKMLVIDPFKTSAHNELLRIAAELGTVGLVIYLSLYATVIAHIRNAMPSMPVYTPEQRLRLRLGIALLAYGFATNLFLSGGGINLFFVYLPAALVFSAPVLVPRTAPARRPLPRVVWRSKPAPSQRSSQRVAGE